MKKLMTCLLLACMAGVLAQTKSTGVKTIGSMTIKIDLNQATSLVTMTMTGPSTKWLCVGFNATTMSTNTPIDCFTYTTTVLDQRLTGGHNKAVTDAVNNLTLVSNTVTGTTRTVVVTRPFNTGDTNDYTFSYALTSLNIIWAVGPSTNFASEHATKGASSVTFTAVLGTEDFALAQQVRTYPNPSDGNFFIANPKLSKIETVNLYDTNARLLKEIKVASSQAEVPMTLSGLDAGIYFVEIMTADDRTVKKIQINQPK